MAFCPSIFFSHQRRKSRWKGGGGRAWYIEPPNKRIPSYNNTTGGHAMPPPPPPQEKQKVAARKSGALACLYRNFSLTARNSLKCSVSSYCPAHYSLIKSQVMNNKYF